MSSDTLICHDQFLLTANELHFGYADCAIRAAFDNRFASFLMYCANEFGKVATQPITFVLDQ